MGYQNKLPKLLLAMPLPPPYSGPETYTRMLLASPLQEHFKIIHLDTSNKASNVNRGWMNWQNSVVTLRNLLLLLWLIWRKRPDLAVLLMPMNRSGFIKFASFALLCIWSGVRVISSSQGSHFNRFYESEAPWMKRLIRYTLRHIDAVIVLAHCLKHAFESFLPPEKIWTVYLGLDTKMFDGIPLRGDKGTGINVLYVGHISKAKGALDLLQAIPKVLSRHPNTRFQFVGEILKRERNITFIDNPNDIEAEAYKLINREKVRERVDLLGIVTGRAKLKVFAEADIFVLPSYAEGFPWSVLEAMLAGKAVVTTPVGALPEVFKHEKHLLFVNPGDIEGIASSINRLIEDSGLRKRLGQAAREIVRRQFNLQNLADQMEMVFKSVLGGGGA